MTRLYEYEYNTIILQFLFLIDIVYLQPTSYLFLFWKNNFKEYIVHLMGYKRIFIEACQSPVCEQFGWSGSSAGSSNKGWLIWRPSIIL